VKNIFKLYNFDFIASLTIYDLIFVCVKSAGNLNFDLYELIRSKKRKLSGSDSAA